MSRRKGALSEQAHRRVMLLLRYRKVRTPASIMLTAFAEALVVDSCFFLVVVLLFVLSEVFSPSVVLTVGTEGSTVVLTTGAVIGATVRLMSVVTC